MSILHPAILLALPAILIPLIIHLLHRRRFQKKEWGAMMFLREALEERKGHHRLRHWIILALRIDRLTHAIVSAEKNQEASNKNQSAI